MIAGLPSTRVLQPVLWFALLGSACRYDLERTPPGAQPLDARPVSDGASPRDRAGDRPAPSDGPRPDALRGDALSGDARCAANEELLDGRDNDCDGLRDEGHWVAPEDKVSYADLAADDAGCTSASPAGEACMTAAHRRCVKRGYVGGFGPLEIGPAYAYASIACLADAQLLSVPLATLAGQQPQCAASAAFSVFCVTAAHRHCQSLGRAGGVGPIEHGAGSASLLCTDHARMIYASFSELAAQLPTCVAEPPFSAECRAAANRVCVQRGHRAGFGPVEQSGSTAALLCFDAK